MQDNFIDHVRISVASGKGGAGSAHLRKEKYVPKGGPDGETVGVEETLLSWAIATAGHFSI